MCLESFPMNIKRFILSFIAVFIFIFFFDHLLHGVLLDKIYKETASLWRPEKEICQLFHWLVVGQLTLALLLCIIFIKGYQNRGILEGVRFGILMGLLFVGPSLIHYAVSPLPMKLVFAWNIGHIVEFVGAGVILTLIYRPLSASEK